MTTSMHATQDRQLFNDIAEHYCGKDRTESSRVARRHRLRQTLELVPLDNARTVLEVGCGAGFSADYLEGRYERFVGVDYADELIRYARVYHGRAGVEFHTADIRNFDYNHPFDIVVMIGVLHHFDDIPAAMQHIVGLVRPGGWVVANEPQPGNPLVQAARVLRKSIDRTYSSDQVTLDRDELQSLYSDAGLSDVRIEPQGVFSTPFAEVVLPPQPVTRVLAKAACQVDQALEQALSEYLGSVELEPDRRGAETVNHAQADIRETACAGYLPRARLAPRSTVESLVRFLQLSGLSLLLNLGLTILCHEVLRLPAELAYAIALATVLATNFTIMRWYVFPNSGQPLARQASEFAAISFLFRGLEYVAFLVLHTVLGLAYIVAIVVVTGLAFVAKFLFYRRCVFGTRTSIES